MAQERVQQRTVEQIVDDDMPQFAGGIISGRTVQERTAERIVVPQERVR